MEVKIDQDVLNAAVFLQRHVPTARLVSVAAGLNDLAPLLWGHYQQTEVKPVRLVVGDVHTQQVSNGSLPVPASADGDLAAEADVPA